MSKSRAGVVGWVNIDALNLASELLFKRLEREQIVAKDELVVEKVVRLDAVRRVAGLGRIFQQNTRLKLGPVFLPNPRQFQFLFSAHRPIQFGSASLLKNTALRFLASASILV